MENSFVIKKNPEILHTFILPFLEILPSHEPFLEIQLRVDHLDHLVLIQPTNDFTPIAHYVPNSKVDCEHVVCNSELWGVSR